MIFWCWSECITSIVQQKGFFTKCWSYWYRCHKLKWCDVMNQTTNCLQNVHNLCKTSVFDKPAYLWCSIDNNLNKRPRKGINLLGAIILCLSPTLSLLHLYLAPNTEINKLNRGTKRFLLLARKKRLLGFKMTDWLQCSCVISSFRLRILHINLRTTVTINNN